MHDAIAEADDKKDHHPMLRPKLDKEFSFNSEEDVDDEIRVEVDPVHRAVGRESWYQVSHNFIFVFGAISSSLYILACAHDWFFWGVHHE